MRHREHRAIDRIVLGREYTHVHRWIDEPAKYLGRRHRALRHDVLSLFLKYGISPEFVSGVLHVLADEWSSKRYRSYRRVNRRW